jgi:hypothetical protein
MPKYTIDVPVELTDEQVAALREQHGLGPDDDVTPYVMLMVQEAGLRAVPGATVAVTEVDAEK